MSDIIQSGEAETPAAEAPASQAPAFQYVVPDWFFHNIKTADDLKDIKAKIWLVDEAETESHKKPDEGQDVSVEGSATHPDKTPAGSEETPQVSQTSDVPPGETVDDSDNASDGTTIPTPESSLSGSDDGRDSCFGITRDDFEDVLDAAVFLHVSERTRKFVTRGSTLGLYSQMRYGHQFLDELVLRMAQELQCSLLSFHPHELEDVAMDFYDQECAAVADGRLESSSVNADATRPDTASNPVAYAEKMFGVRAERKATEEDTKRARQAYFALLEAVKGQSVSESEKQQGNRATAAEDASPNSPNTPTPSFIIYVRDALRLFDSDTARGRRIMCRMRDAVKKQREAGQNILMVVGMTHSDVDATGQKFDAAVPWKVTECQCSLCQCHSLTDCDSRSCDMGAPMRKLGARGLLQKMLMPLSVPEGWAETRKAGSQGSPSAVKIQSFKRKLQARLSEYPADPSDLLERDSDWLSLLSEEAGSSLLSKIHSDEKMQAAFTRIIGKSIRKKMVDLAVMESVFLDPKKAETTESANESKKEADLSEEERAKKAKKEWEDKLTEIKRETSQYEDNLLPCLVDPTSLQADFDDVVLDKGVLDNIKTLVHLSKLRPEASSKFLVSQIRTTGALLYGPPGTGKTLLARAIARATGSHMLTISPAVIENKYVGESEKTIEALFTLARRLSPCIVFIDEVDALFYRRGCEDKSWQRSKLTQFLQEMDGLGQDPKAPFVLAATNRPGDLDSAFLRRLPHKVAFAAPDAAARARILRVFLKDDDLDGEDAGLLDRLAAQTPGFSGSDLRNLCGQAGLAWAVEQDLVASGESGAAALRVRLTEAHFRTALASVQPSIAQGDMSALDDFTRRFGPAGRVPRTAKRLT